MNTLLPFKSNNIIRIFQELIRGPKLARDLAAVIHTHSKEIYPRVKRYILKGWIQVTKINNINVYSLSETAKKILQLQGSFERIKEKAEKVLGRKLDEDEVEILRFFYELNGYVERSENESIGEQVYYSLKRKIQLSRVTEILEEFTKARVLFAYRLKNGIILKVRLNKSLLE
ncbi:conjugal transfer protein [Sulfurisphaera ohwakuensis]|uniref:conjugal transfer protein n=1 Tax=Sulfurisphaera ohwakuensis TaxID=69656 RepID=UPI0036F1A3AB